MNRRISVAIRSVLVNLSENVFNNRKKSEKHFVLRSKSTDDVRRFCLRIWFLWCVRWRISLPIPEKATKNLIEWRRSRSSNLFVRFFIFDFFHFRFVPVHRLFDFFDLMAERLKRTSEFDERSIFVQPLSTLSILFSSSTEDSCLWFRPFSLCFCLRQSSLFI